MVFSEVEVQVGLVEDSEAAEVVHLADSENISNASDIQVTSKIV